MHIKTTIKIQIKKAPFWHGKLQVSHSYHISPTAANKHQLNCCFCLIFTLSFAFFIKRKAMSSSATHFTLLKQCKGQSSKVKEKFFSHSHACLCFTEQHYRCGVSLKRLNGLLPLWRDLCEKKNTPLIVPCSVPITGQSTPCYCIFAQYFSSHNGWQRGWCEFTVPPLWQ